MAENDGNSYVKVILTHIAYQEDNLTPNLENADLKKLLLDDMLRLAQENNLSGLEKIKKVHLIQDPFSVENDILTPKMSLKRHVAKKIFAKQIEVMYADTSV